MQTLESLRAIAAKLKYKDWIFRVDDKTGETPFLQIQFWDKDLRTGNLELQNCRKWQLSYHMVPCEIVRTARKALHTAMEHEVDEQFSYDGEILFHPHHDLDAMVDFAKKRRISVRK
jgi:hypothetical protein